MSIESFLDGNSPRSADFTVDMRRQQVYEQKRGYKRSLAAILGKQFTAAGSEGLKGLSAELDKDLAVSLIPDARSLQKLSPQKQRQYWLNVSAIWLGTLVANLEETVLGERVDLPALVADYNTALTGTNFQRLVIPIAEVRTLTTPEWITMLKLRDQDKTYVSFFANGGVSMPYDLRAFVKQAIHPAIFTRMLVLLPSFEARACVLEKVQIDRNWQEYYLF